jgi:hypothetical protein
MRKSSLPVNYSIEHLVRSIAADNPTGTKYDAAEKKALFSATREKVAGQPGLKKLLSIANIRHYNVTGAENFARIGVLPPELIVVDDRIKEMCALPFWIHGQDGDGNPVKRFGKCPGYNVLPGCPPHSIATTAVKDKLKEADLFVVLQTRLLCGPGSGYKFKVLRRLARDIEKLLGKGSVVERYGSGPCGACGDQACLSGGSCAKPGLRAEALESMGISVDRICTDLSELTGQRAWEIKFIRHFGFPEQTPKRWKYVLALGVKL